MCVCGFLPVVGGCARLLWLFLPVDDWKVERDGVWDLPCGGCVSVCCHRWVGRMCVLTHGHVNRLPAPWVRALLLCIFCPLRCLTADAPLPWCGLAQSQRRSDCHSNPCFDCCSFYGGPAPLTFAVRACGVLSSVLLPFFLYALEILLPRVTPLEQANM